MWMRYRAGASLLALALLAGLLAGCGSTGSTTDVKAVCIGADFPTSGATSSPGKLAENGALLAIDQAKLHGGYTVTVRAFDNTTSGTPDASHGAANLTAMVSDGCILAVVGPTNDDVAAAEIPLAANSGLALISPASTNPGLTKEADAPLYGLTFAAVHPTGKPENYFRITTTDDVESAATAQTALALGLKKAYVVDDAQLYGKNVAAFFAQAFTTHGGTIAGSGSLTGTDTAQLDALVARIKGTPPDVVYYGGLTATGAALRVAMSSAGLASVPLLGSSGIANDPAFVQSAGNAAEGTLATLAAPDVTALTSSAAQQFIKDYRAKYNSVPTAYSATAFDAANVELAAINAVIDAGQTPTRANVLAQLAHANYDGLTGHIAFDANGDNVIGKVVSVYAVKDGAWQYVKQITG